MFNAPEGGAVTPRRVADKLGGVSPRVLAGPWLNIARWSVRRGPEPRSFPFGPGSLLFVVWMAHFSSLDTHASSW